MMMIQILVIKPEQLRKKKIKYTKHKIKINYPQYLNKINKKVIVIVQDVN